MTSLVAFDLETTGLDPRRDAIIEIGAIRFNEKRVEGEYTYVRRLDGIIVDMPTANITNKEVLN